MIAGLRLALIHSFLISCWALRHVGYGGWRHAPRHIVVYVIFVPSFWLLQILHWLGFAIDECLFRGYRRVRIRRPVFIVGVPRSGTTFMQRLLARHPEMTSTTLAEGVLMPSVTARYLGRFAAGVLGPLKRRFNRFLGNNPMQAAHALGVGEAEEDFLLLLSVGGCCVLFTLFPHARHFWNLTDFQSSVSKNRRADYVRFYRRMVQKHLYFHGADRRYLAKNPSFTSWAADLEATFDDATFVVCSREAQSVIPSQLSALRPAWKLVHGGRLTPEFEADIVQMLERYYAIVAADKTRWISVPIERLKLRLSELIREIATQAQLPLPPEFTDEVQRAAQAQAGYQSTHRYDLGAFHTSWADVAGRFSKIEGTCA